MTNPETGFYQEYLPAVDETPVTAINVGDDLTVSFTVTNPPSGATGIIYIVDPKHIGNALVKNIADSSIFTFTFSFSDLLGGPVVRDSITVNSRLIDALPEGDPNEGDPKFVGNNQRITAVAFLKDRAGNLSARTQDSPEPEPAVAANIHVLDLTPPTISPVRPTTGEPRFTALINTTVSTVNLTDGTTSMNHPFDLNPFEFSVDEGLADIQVTFVTDGGDEISLSHSGENNAGDLVKNDVIKDGST